MIFILESQDQVRRTTTIWWSVQLFKGSLCYSNEASQFSSIWLLFWQLSFGKFLQNIRISTHRIQRYDPLYDDLISAWQLFSSSQTQRQPLLFKPSFTIFSDWMRTEQELQNFVISTFNCTSDWFVDIKIYIKRWEKRNVNMICSEYQNTSIIYSYIHTSVHF